MPFASPAEFACALFDAAAGIAPLPPLTHQRSDAGFKVGDEHAAGIREVRRLRAEIERLEDAKRRALQLADERAKEANALRSELHTRRKL